MVVVEWCIDDWWLWWVMLYVMFVVVGLGVGLLREFCYIRILLSILPR